MGGGTYFRETWEERMLPIAGSCRYRRGSIHVVKIVAGESVMDGVDEKMVGSSKIRWLGVASLITCQLSTVRQDG